VADVLSGIWKFLFPNNPLGGIVADSDLCLAPNVKYVKEDGNRGRSFDGLAIAVWTALQGKARTKLEHIDRRQMNARFNSADRIISVLSS
jgi:hypothetical protein